jgi:hypothetical protein
LWILQNAEKLTNEASQYNSQSIKNNPNYRLEVTITWHIWQQEQLDRSNGSTEVMCHEMPLSITVHA